MYSVIETRKNDVSEHHKIIRTGLSKEMAEKVRACRAYANKVKGRSWEVAVVAENDRVHRVGRASRERAPEIHP